MKVRLSDEESEQLRELADACGLNVADWVRQTIRRDHTDLPKKPRKKQ